MTEQDHAAERRSYMLDAGADVVVLLCFVAGALIGAFFEKTLTDKSWIEEATLVSLQIGCMATVINHTLTLIWKRTFFGPLVVSGYQKLRKRLSGRDDNDPDAPTSGAGTGQPNPKTLPRRPSWRIAPFATVHFNAVSLGRRLSISMTVFGVVFVLTLVLQAIHAGYVTIVVIAVFYAIVSSHRSILVASLLGGGAAAIKLQEKEEQKRKAGPG